MLAVAPDPPLTEMQAGVPMSKEDRQVWMALLSDAHRVMPGHECPWECVYVARVRHPWWHGRRHEAPRFFSQAQVCLCAPTKYLGHGWGPPF